MKHVLSSDQYSKESLDSPIISVKDTKAPTLAMSDVNFTVGENG